MLAALALGMPAVSTYAAEDASWNAAVVIEKQLDRDGDLLTEDDRGHAGAGWEFAITIDGSDDTHLLVRTDDEGRVDASVEVATPRATVRVTEVATEAALIGIYGLDLAEDKLVSLPIASRGATVEVFRDTDILPRLVFVNVGEPTLAIDARVEGWVDGDGDVATLDRAIGAGWAYDLTVSGTAEVEPSVVDTGPGGDAGRFVIRLPSGPTTLELTQHVRHGYALLDAYVVGTATPSSLDGQTLTVQVDGGLHALTVVFVNHRTASASTSTPTGEVPDAPAATLPPTDGAQGAAGWGPAITVAVPLALAGIGAVMLDRSRTRRHRR